MCSCEQCTTEGLVHCPSPSTHTIQRLVVQVQSAWPLAGCRDRLRGQTGHAMAPTDCSPGQHRLARDQETLPRLAAGDSGCSTSTWPEMQCSAAQGRYSSGVQSEQYSPSEKAVKQCLPVEHCDQQGTLSPTRLTEWRAAAAGC